MNSAIDTATAIGTALAVSQRVSVPSSPVVIGTRGAGDQRARPGRGQVLEERDQLADPLRRGHPRRTLAVFLDVQPSGADVLGENVQRVLAFVVAQPHVAHGALSGPARGGGGIRRAARDGGRGRGGGGRACGPSRGPTTTNRARPARSGRR